MDVLIDQLTNFNSLVGHLNYVLVILSVSMSSMRWLRIFAIASGVVGVFYYGFLVNDRISAGWEFIFAAVNAVQLAIVLLAGRRRATGDDEKFLVETVMPTIEPNLRARMLKLARWQTREPGDLLVEEGQATPDLVFIATGAASVERGGKIVGVCGPGDFLGEMSFLSGRPASATVRVANEVRCCIFDPAVLKAVSKKNPGIRQALEYSFNRNLVGKLERMNDANHPPAPDKPSAKLADEKAEPAPPIMTGEEPTTLPGA
ncbi:MAG: cyclic nucleotide-binding domain-containing protein [Mesorhizobium sp.]